MRTQHITKTTKKHSIILSIDDADVRLHDVVAAIRMVEVELEYGDEDSKRFLPYVEYNLGSLIDTPLSNEEIVGEYLTALFKTYADIDINFPKAVLKIKQRMDGDESNPIYKLINDFCEQIVIFDTTTVDAFNDLPFSDLEVEIKGDSLYFSFTTQSYFSIGLF